jgi:hypothetical protein
MGGNANQMLGTMTLTATPTTPALLLAVIPVPAYAWWHGPTCGSAAPSGTRTTRRPSSFSHRRCRSPWSGAMRHPRDRTGTTARARRDTTPTSRNARASGGAWRRSRIQRPRCDRRPTAPSPSALVTPSQRELLAVPVRGQGPAPPTQRLQLRRRHRRGAGCDRRVLGQHVQRSGAGDRQTVSEHRRRKSSSHARVPINRLAAPSVAP